MGILSGCPARLTTLEAEEISTQVGETGLTFEQNAILKAAAYREMSGLATLADDSGLVVDALDGLPGVRSARYAGEHATDLDNLEKLLHAMRGVPPERRTARFECVVALALPGRDIVTFAGTVEGTIACQPAGGAGFGYDPVFVLKGVGNDRPAQAMAHMSIADKADLSHRGQAARNAADWLRRLAMLGNSPYN